MQIAISIIVIILLTAGGLTFKDYLDHPDIY